jgi:exopolysaccharide/PEP-CTERM locus tyrosine autokinase
MGRIEDALRKLQQQSAAREPATAPARKPDPVAVVTETREREDVPRKRVEFDHAALRANGLLAPDTEERALSEQYRAIKRPILRNAARDRDPPLDRGNLLMVASAFSGEGKTFTCINLCLSIAREKDWSVVLVDGDCRKPDLTRLFAAENEPGLIDLLRDPSLSFEPLVLPTNVPGLSLLPSGVRDEHAAELLASNRMDDVCQRLAEERHGRLTVFDSSPLLLATEAAALATHVGQIALVVRANATPRHAVAAALDKLDPAKAIACILNQSYSTDLGLGYGDQYGYGHPAAGERGA